MAMDVGSKKGPRGDINVTPLIDVVLVLLIIFMVLTPSMLKHLTATVPKKAEDDTPQPPGETIMVEYTAKRELSINGEPVAPEALAERWPSGSARPPEGRVLQGRGRGALRRGRAPDGHGARLGRQDAGRRHQGSDGGGRLTSRATGGRRSGAAD